MEVELLGAEENGGSVALRAGGIVNIMVWFSAY